MKFTTTVEPAAAKFRIAHTHRLLSLGSCFAANIGEALMQRKFDLLQQPFGTLYNPISIATGLRRMLNAQPYRVDDLFQHHGLWRNFDHHGSYGGTDREATLARMNGALQRAADYLRTTDRILITLGSAFVFTDLQQNRVVANCHQLPARRFQRRRLSVREIENALWEPLAALVETQPDLKVILTVSPVRHLRDGVVENQRSKAALLLAVEELTKRSDRIHYFEAYEILLDELRDYRFYDQDLVHPSKMAIAVIWERFERTFCSPQTQTLSQRIEKLRQAAYHRPLHPKTEAHQLFQKKTKVAIEELQQEYPYLNLSEELTMLSN